MKGNFYKYIFLIFIVIIVGFAIYKISTNDSTTKGINPEETSQSTKVSEINLAVAGLDNINPIISKNRNVQDISKLILKFNEI